MASAIPRRNRSKSPVRGSPSVKRERSPKPQDLESQWKRTGVMQDWILTLPKHVQTLNEKVRAKIAGVFSKYRDTLQTVKRMQKAEAVASTFSQKDTLLLLNQDLKMFQHQIDICFRKRLTIPEYMTDKFKDDRAQEIKAYRLLEETKHQLRKEIDGRHQDVKSKPTSPPPTKPPAREQNLPLGSDLQPLLGATVLSHRCYTESGGSKHTTLRVVKAGVVYRCEVAGFLDLPERSRITKLGLRDDQVPYFEFDHPECKHAQGMASMITNTPFQYYITEEKVQQTVKPILTEVKKPVTIQMEDNDDSESEEDEDLPLSVLVGATVTRYEYAARSDKLGFETDITAVRYDDHFCREYNLLLDGFVHIPLNAVITEAGQKVFHVSSVGELPAPCLTFKDDKGVIQTEYFRMDVKSSLPSFDFAISLKEKPPRKPVAIAVTASAVVSTTSCSGGGGASGSGKWLLWNQNPEWKEMVEAEQRKRKAKSKATRKSLDEVSAAIIGCELIRPGVRVRYPKRNLEGVVSGVKQYFVYLDGNNATKYRAKGLLIQDD